MKILNIFTSGLPGFGPPKKYSEISHQTQREFHSNSYSIEYTEFKRLDNFKYRIRDLVSSSNISAIVPHFPFSFLKPILEEARLTNTQIIYPYITPIPIQSRLFSGYPFHYSNTIKLLIDNLSYHKSNICLIHNGFGYSYFFLDLLKSLSTPKQISHLDISNFEIISNLKENISSISPELILILLDEGYSGEINTFFIKHAFNIPILFITDLPGGANPDSILFSEKISALSIHENTNVNDLLLRNQFTSIEEVTKTLKETELKINFIDSSSNLLDTRYIPQDSTIEPVDGLSHILEDYFYKDFLFHTKSNIESTQRNFLEKNFLLDTILDVNKKISIKTKNNLQRSILNLENENDFQLFFDNKLEKFTGWFEFVDPEDIPNVRDTINSLSPNNAKFHIRYKLRNKDNQHLNIEEVGLGLFAENNLVEIISVIKDISKELHKENQNKYLTERWSAIIDLPCLLFLSTDSDGIVIESNKAFRDKLGYTKQDLINKKYSDLINPDDHQIAEKIRNNLLSNQINNFKKEVRYINKYGVSFWMDVSFAVVRNDHKECLYILEAAVDITQRKLNEEELRISKDLSNSANQLKSDFLNNLSQELRTPMNGIIGLSQILLNSDLSRENLDMVNNILVSSESIMQLISGILDYSNLESGNTSSNMNYCILTNSLINSLHMYIHNCKSKNIELIFHIDPFFLDPIMIDESKLVQIILQILSNSVKFTERGEIQVSIVHEFKDMDYLILTITDTGTGMPENLQNEILESFQTDRDILFSDYSNHKLGLAITGRIIKLLSGKLFLSSKPNIGTEFKVEIPIGKTKNSSVSKIQYPFLGKALILDKNLSSCISLSNILNYYGIHADHCQDETCALSKLSNLKFSILIIDENFSNSGGYEYKQYLEKKIPDNHFIFCLITSNSILSDIRKKAYDYNIYKLLSKPYFYHDVQKFLDEIPQKPIYIESSIVYKEDSQKFRVLIVEDNIINRLVLKNILIKLGYSILESENGRDALNLLYKEDVDFIFMDIHMPIYDGIETTKIIRKLNSKSKTIPIVAITADAHPDRIAACINAGMNDFLPKPFRINEIEEMLEKYIHNTIIG
ncbi:MAG: response regulator [Leptospiraceae bacterium]|nr:response regulator [Leptospiraceae bacterium]MCP5513758.1 response regulator [Leptospiraceae bacterium]